MKLQICSWLRSHSHLTFRLENISMITRQLLACGIPSSAFRLSHETVKEPVEQDMRDLGTIVDHMLVKVHDQTHKQLTRILEEAGTDTATRFSGINNMQMIYSNDYPEEQTYLLGSKVLTILKHRRIGELHMGNYAEPGSH